MNILLLEDRGSTAFFLERRLKENGHNVLSASNINDSQMHWVKRNEVPIHCIIIDLQVPTIGLTQEQKNHSFGGTLTGWIWLYDNVLTEAPEMRQRTIIYSDYINILNDQISSDKYRGVTVISKKQRSSSADNVVARIQEIARMTK